MSYNVDGCTVYDGCIDALEFGSDTVPVCTFERYVVLLALASGKDVDC